ncbi:hypothetical protein GPECTOR_77g27 [Gonium pectorale]|uniref:DUF202 domain-containing protein n=1 Tax=Gonium pectorale TaxID=33097 RepID=A0A150G3P6_GONPE|nr:hypothetical protein GPECTOR_77g27 [Gonium pectorale]|eukprot:KXZ43930.1 hypothetical protein GPECTOR_77g27 [Gonium pectorale]
MGPGSSASGSASGNSGSGTGGGLGSGKVGDKASEGSGGEGFGTTAGGGSDGTDGAWLQRGRRSTTKSRAAHVRAFISNGAGAARFKAAVLAVAVARRGGGGGGVSKADGGGKSWVAAKWSALRHDKGDGGGGDGGRPDVELGSASSSSLPRAASLVRTRVEPKTFFAAERTFLSWLNIAVLVMFTSLSLMADRLAMFGGHQSVAALPLPDGTTPGVAAVGTPVGAGGGGAGGGGGGGRAALCSGGVCHSSQIAGMIMAPVSLAFMFYALYMYRKRSAQILRRESVRFDDQRGPVLLTCMLMVVLVVAYVLTVKAVS